MSLPNPYAQYRQNSVETATPTRMVVMLYDGAIRFLSQALPAMQAKKYDQQSLLIGKAQSIIGHLRDTLNHDTGSAFAGSLDGIYVALLHSLTEASIYDRSERIEEVIVVLRELRETWAEVDRRCQVNKAIRTDDLELMAA